MKPEALPLFRSLARDGALFGLTVIGGLTVTAAVAPIGSVITLATHFVPFYFVGALLVLALAAGWRDRFAVAAASLLVAWHGSALLPYLPVPGSAHAAEDRDVRIMVCNVLRHNTSKSDLKREILRYDPDVILLQETDRAWIDGMESVTKHYPNAVEEARTDNFGIALYSRLPLREESIVHFGGVPVPAVSAQILVGETWVRFLGVHTLTPMRLSRRMDNASQMADIPNFVVEIEVPFVLMGDLNNTMWSPAYRKMIRETALKNVREGRGLYPTWPAGLSPLAIPIDHVLVNDAWTVQHVETGDWFGSDHLPLVVDLRLAVPRAES